jgi:glycosyltransferase involved in cell wall biosynthesis
MDLSVVLGGRDDNYGENFIPRLKQSVENNLSKLDKSGLDYEMLVVDFNPLNSQYLHKNALLTEALSHPKVKNIIVDNSVVLAENLGPTTYYEYFAKNVGCKNSSGELIFITNSDILITDCLVEELIKETKNENKDDYFYRVRYRGEVPLGMIPDEENEPVEDLHHPEFPDACICGLFSGDASMFSREVLFNVATAYNEGETRHRTHVHQSAMDGEILWNVYKKGKKLRFLEAHYYHIFHGPRPLRDNFYFQGTYENKDDWGFVNYSQEKINENTILINA